jgi:hypothetical protein
MRRRSVVKFPYCEHCGDAFKVFRIEPLKIGDDLPPEPEAYFARFAIAYGVRVTEHYHA